MAITLLGNIMNKNIRHKVTLNTQNLTNMSHNEESMSAENIYHGGRIIRTEKMCVDIILCEKKANELQDSDQCPKERKRKGKKD